MRQLNLTTPPNITDLWVKGYDDSDPAINIPITTVLLDRWVIRMDNGGPSGAINLKFRANGYAEFSCRMTIPSDNTANEGDVIVALEPSEIPFPPGSKNAPLPEYESSDSDGIVHMTMSNDAQPLYVPQIRRKDVMRGDFAGVTTPETPPFIDGANSTPQNMWLTFFLHRYIGLLTDAGNDCIDYFLTWYTRQLGYTHILLGGPCVEMGFSIDEHVAFFKYVQDKFGLEVIYWAMSSGMNGSDWQSAQPLIEPFLRALITAGCAKKLIMIIGGEMDGYLQPPGMKSILDNLLPITNDAGIPTYVHFRPNYRPEYNLINWQDYDGEQEVNGGLFLTGVCWQGYQDDSAGKMGAMMWYVRRYLGPISDRFKVVAFELLASNKLYGRCDELHGCLRGLEMIQCTSDGTAPPVMGFMDGGRYRDGSII